MAEEFRNSTLEAYNRFLEENLQTTNFDDTCRSFGTTKALKDFLSKHKESYGLSQEQINKMSADETCTIIFQNPSGNPKLEDCTSRKYSPKQIQNYVINNKKLIPKYRNELVSTIRKQSQIELCNSVNNAINQQPQHPEPQQPQQPQPQQPQPQQNVVNERPQRNPNYRKVYNNAVVPGTNDKLNLARNCHPDPPYRWTKANAAQGIKQGYCEEDLDYADYQNRLRAWENQNQQPQEQEPQQPEPQQPQEERPHVEVWRNANRLMKDCKPKPPFYWVPKKESDIGKAYCKELVQDQPQPQQPEVSNENEEEIQDKIIIASTTLEDYILLKTWDQVKRISDNIIEDIVKYKIKSEKYTHELLLKAKEELEKVNVKLSEISQNYFGKKDTYKNYILLCENQKVPILTDVFHKWFTDSVSEFTSNNAENIIRLLKQINNNGIFDYIIRQYEHYSTRDLQTRNFLSLKYGLAEMLLTYILSNTQYIINKNNLNKAGANKNVAYSSLSFTFVTHQNYIIPFLNTSNNFILDEKKFICTSFPAIYNITKTTLLNDIKLLKYDLPMNIMIMQNYPNYIYITKGYMFHNGININNNYLRQYIKRNGDKFILSDILLTIPFNIFKNLFFAYFIDYKILINTYLVINSYEDLTNILDYDIIPQQEFNLRYNQQNQPQNAQQNAEKINLSEDDINNIKDFNSLREVYAKYNFSTMVLIDEINPEHIELSDNEKRNRAFPLLKERLKRLVKAHNENGPIYQPTFLSRKVNLPERTNELGKWNYQSHIAGLYDIDITEKDYDRNAPKFNPKFLTIIEKQNILKSLQNYYKSKERIPLDQIDENGRADIITGEQITDEDDDTKYAQDFKKDYWVFINSYKNSDKYFAYIIEYAIEQIEKSFQYWDPQSSRVIPTLPRDLSSQEFFSPTSLYIILCAGAINGIFTNKEFKDKFPVTEELYKDHTFFRLYEYLYYFSQSYIDLEIYYSRLPKDIINKDLAIWNKRDLIAISWLEDICKTIGLENVGFRRYNFIESARNALEVNYFCVLLDYILKNHIAILTINDGGIRTITWKKGKKNSVEYNRQKSSLYDDKSIARSCHADDIVFNARHFDKESYRNL